MLLLIYIIGVVLALIINGFLEGKGYVYAEEVFFIVTNSLGWPITLVCLILWGFVMFGMYLSDCYSDWLDKRRKAKRAAQLAAWRLENPPQ